MNLMHQEIEDQPEALARLLDAERPAARRIAEDLKRRGLRRILLAARGSSDHAAIYGQYLFQIENLLPCALAAPSVFTRYRVPAPLTDTLVIGVSQSGEAPDVLGVLEEARRQGALTVGVTNDPTSPLATQCDHALLIHAGEERSVAATKTYMNSLGALLLLSVALGPRSPGLPAALDRLPEALAAALGGEDAIAARVERYRYMAECVTLSRGLSLCTALEAALKLTETCRIVARPFSSADFLHGPFTLAAPGFPCILFIPPGPCRDDVRDLHRQLVEARAETLVFTLGDDPAPDGATVHIPVPAVVDEEAMAPFLHGAGLQLLACHLSVLRGLDPDHPPGLTKVTHTL